MLRFWQQIRNSQQGQALPIVLSLLVIGGLTIAPSLNYTATSLKSGRILEENLKGIYAADAGLEQAIWTLENGVSPPPYLAENLNRMPVALQAEEKGTYTLYLGELIQPGEHNDFLAVDGELVWDDGAGAYRYTITVTLQPESESSIIHLEEVGARIPVGYGYQSGSAADFTENLSTGEPSETVDTQGAYLLNWELATPYPSVSETDPVQTQAFYLTGEGSQERHYAWAVANREDIGAVGEITGTSYLITASATNPEDGQTTARIVAEVMIGSGMTNILSWQISN